MKKSFLSLLVGATLFAGTPLLAMEEDMRALEKERALKIVALKILGIYAAASSPFEQQETESDTTTTTTSTPTEDVKHHSEMSLPSDFWHQIDSISLFVILKKINKTLVPAAILESIEQSISMQFTEHERKAFKMEWLSFLVAESLEYDVAKTFYKKVIRQNHPQLALSKAQKEDLIEKASWLVLSEKFSKESYEKAFIEAFQKMQKKNPELNSEGV